MWTLLMAAIALAHEPEPETEFDFDPLHHDVSAGGVTLHSAWTSTLGTRERVPSMGCIGGMGFEVDGVLRVGGEGHWCGGAASGMAYGGAQGGAWFGFGPVAFSPYVTGGFGWRSAEPDVGSAFVFAKPTLAFSVSFGFVGVELSGYTGFGGEFASWSADGPSRTPEGIVWSGSQVSLLFGEFWPHRKPSPPVVRAEDPPPVQPAPLAIAADPTRPPEPDTEPRSLDEAIDHMVEELRQSVERMEAEVREGEVVDEALQDAADALRRAAEAIEPKPEPPEDAAADDEATEPEEAEVTPKP